MYVHTAVHPDLTPTINPATLPAVVGCENDSGRYHSTCGSVLDPRPGSGIVGHTPVVWISAPLSAPDRGFWAKLEGFNPGGMKDRPAMHMVERARARGDLQSGARIVESTSGTLGLGLALAGNVYRHPVTLVRKSVV